MLRLLTTLFTALLVCAAEAGEALRLAPGASKIVELPENPSTGYTWRIDRAASEGLGALSIVDGGHLKGRAMPGAPGRRRWTIRALQPGVATVVFAYQRPWEPEAVETRRVDVEIAR